MKYPLISACKILPVIITLIFIIPGMKGFSHHPSFSGNYKFSSWNKKKDTIEVESQSLNKKIKVKVYPNENKEALFFEAGGKKGMIFQFFLFDLEGKLIREISINFNQTTLIKNLEKGAYLFDVFTEDDRIETGQITVR